MSYRSCKLEQTGILCPEYKNCYICKKTNKSDDVLDIIHTNIINRVYSNKQNILIEVIVKNKTEQLVKNLSIKELLITGICKYGLRNIIVNQDCKSILVVDGYNASDHIMTTGEILVPCDSQIYPNDSFSITYELLSLENGDNHCVNTIISSISLSGKEINTEYSKIYIEPINYIGCPCISIKNTDIVYEIIISSDNKWIFGYPEYTEDIDGNPNSKFKIYNIIKRISSPYQVVKMDYLITNNDPGVTYKLVKAEGFTGDNLIINLFDWTSSNDKCLLGKIIYPIGRHTDFSNNQDIINRFVIQRLIFKFQKIIVV
jgi:hypothetical protein